MNRVYTITFTRGHANVPAVERTARRLTGNGAAVQDQGGRSVSYRITGATPGDRDRKAITHARAALEGFTGPWELATGMGVHRRVVEAGGRDE